jgi:KaiC/GvpD/RAD55 family RecA-like ATPase/ActR/RegA family two-component response regulator
VVTHGPFAFGKAATGIKGFDEITGGGLPKGRATLVCGAAGSGKTLLATEFLVRGATELGERGVFMTFEESVEDLTADVASLGFDLAALIAQKKIIIDHVRINRHEIEETGQYDLDGLFIRLDHAIKSVRAKRVVLDTIEALFAGFSNPGILRMELARLFRWLKDKGVTAIITGERGEGTLTRHGLEEYVSDAVILLDHRVDDQVSTRRLRIVKFRGSSHGTNEYPFLIGRSGLSVLPITSVGLQHEASLDRVSAGVDQMLEHIFDLFWQGQSSPGRSTGGLGIGLTLVRRLVELHDGTVEAVSDGLGCGSEFIVRLPVTKASVYEEAETQAPIHAPSYRVLLIEDNADARDMARLGLELLGQTVSTASNGKTGVEMALADPPDAVIVDIGLPGLDGYEVGRRLREALGDRIRLVALTGYSQPEDRRRVREAGFDVHLVKPVVPPDILRAITTMETNKWEDDGHASGAS